MWCNVELEWKTEEWCLPFTYFLEWLEKHHMCLYFTINNPAIISQLILHKYEHCLYNLPDAAAYTDITEWCWIPFIINTDPPYRTPISVNFNLSDIFTETCTCKSYILMWEFLSLYFASEINGGIEAISKVLSIG